MLLQLCLFLDEFDDHWEELEKQERIFSVVFWIIFFSILAFGIGATIFGFVSVAKAKKKQEQKEIEKKEANTPIPCKYCGFANHPKASKCANCGAILEKKDKKNY